MLAVKEKLEQIQSSMATQKANQLEKTRTKLSLLDLNVKSTLESRNELINALNLQVLLPT